MPEKFKNKYRIPSARLQSWNYANAGAYFITICTKDRQHYLGQIENHKIRLSNIGIIAHIMWFEIKKHVKNVELGEFVVMPNHIHGILILNENVCPNVETLHATSLPQKIDLATNKTELMSAISPKSNSISTIIRSYKSAVTKYCNQLGFDFF
jgi:putative transposase